MMDSRIADTFTDSLTRLEDEQKTLETTASICSSAP